MLVQFAVENFLSFKEEAVLNLVATSQEAHQHHLVDLPKKKSKSVLRASALYGANGSGKSNFIKAIEFSKNLILEGKSASEKFNLRPFKLNPKCAKKPSKFQYIISHENILYDFGFVLNNEVVLEEWLYITKNVKEVLCYERTTTEKGKVKLEIGHSLAPKNTKKYQFLEFVGMGTRPNQLFLYEAHQKNVKEINSLIEWFDDVLTIITPDTHYGNLILDAHKNKSFVEYVSTFLSSVDTGIESIAVEDVVFDPTKHLLDLPSSQKEKLMDVDEKKYAVLSASDGRQYVIHKSKKGEILLRKFKTKHLSEGGEVYFEIEEESDGTRRLMHLVPALIHSRNSEKVFVIDEIDRSMHPLLTKFFVNTYLSETDCPYGQLVFTTHESNLLDLNLLRKDEIWFFEKDKTGSSHLLSLAEFKVRPDLKIQKGYLAGRFGAIPFLGDPSALGVCIP